MMRASRRGGRHPATAHTMGRSGLSGRIDSREAWLITVAALIVPSVSLGAPYIVIVALKPIAADLGGYRSVPAAAAALAMLGTGVGGLAMGWLAERIGIRLTVMLGAADGVRRACSCRPAARSGSSTSGTGCSSGFSATAASTRRSTSM